MCVLTCMHVFLFRRTVNSTTSFGTSGNTESTLTITLDPLPYVVVFTEVTKTSPATVFAQVMIVVV